MKKLLLILTMILVVFALSACEENKVENTITETVISGETIVESGETPNLEVDELLTYVGEEKTGEDVKNLIFLINNKNEAVNYDLSRTIWVKLDAFKGKIASSGDSLKTQKVSDGVGNQYSLYTVSVKDARNSGDNMYYYIQQTVGTKADPDIPYEMEAPDMVIIPAEVGENI